MEELIFNLITPLLLGGTWATGRILENRHFRRLNLLESGSRDILALTVEDLPPEWEVRSSDLVVGNVVVSLDYFKRFAAGLKGVFGGRLGAYEPLLERARREALLRMKAQARARGYDTIINVRIETSRMAAARADGKGTAGVEILAFGTAVDVSRP